MISPVKVKGGEIAYDLKSGNSILTETLCRYRYVSYYSIELYYSSEISKCKEEQEKIVKACEEVWQEGDTPCTQEKDCYDTKYYTSTKTVYIKFRQEFQGDGHSYINWAGSSWNYAGGNEHFDYYHINYNPQNVKDESGENRSLSFNEIPFKYLKFDDETEYFFLL